ncbi:MAG: hypothetical protein LBV40_06915 [Methanomicrobiales archaeon]|jgi:hypothetical protein|nr:hypothetical protein [Methanomicrobiales archaeon]
MYNDGSSQVTMMQLAEVTPSHMRASGVDVIEEIAELEKRVHTWNMEDCRELRGWIVNIQKLLVKHFQIKIEKFTDMQKIPTQKIPEALLPMYDIVAIDKRGICLYGKGMDKLVHIDTLKQHYRKQMQMKKKTE